MYKFTVKEKIKKKYITKFHKPFIGWNKPTNNETRARTCKKPIITFLFPVDTKVELKQEPQTWYRWIWKKTSAYEVYFLNTQIYKWPYFHEDKSTCTQRVADHKMSSFHFCFEVEVNWKISMKIARKAWFRSGSITMLWIHWNDEYERFCHRWLPVIHIATSAILTFTVKQTEVCQKGHITIIT